jgi:hypothetical protein
MVGIVRHRLWRAVKAIIPNQRYGADQPISMFVAMLPRQVELPDDRSIVRLKHFAPMLAP